MATTLTLTPQPVTGSIRLQVAGAPAGPVVITRADANGSGPVRLLAGQTPSAGVLVAFDYEAAIVGTVTYTLVDSAGAVVTSSSTLAGLVAQPWLSVPVMPQLGRAVEDVLDDYAAAQEGRGVLHQVIGRPDPVPTLGLLSARAGSMSILTAGHAEARAVAGVYGRGAVVQLRQPSQPGLDMYHVGTRVSTQPEGTRWIVRVDYTEVARPSGPLLGGLGWDFASVAGAYPDFASQRAAFTDFAALTVGPL